MTKLADLQTRFQHYLLSGEDDVAGDVAGSDDIATAPRLEVYHRAYRLRLLEALGKDYPGLRALVGDETFETICRAYIDRHPSHHPSLRWFGRHLAIFLRSSGDDAAQPLWAEVAEFEWMTGECFDEKDSAIVAVEAMAGVAPDRWAGMRLRFQPAIRRLRLRWNAPAIWQATREAGAMPSTEVSATGVPWLLWRRDMKIHWRSVAGDEDAALAAAMAGAPFGELCELLSAHAGRDAAALRAASLLRQWLSDAMIAGIEFDD